MNRKNVIQTASVALLAGFLSFVVGRLSGSTSAPQGNLAQWLNLTQQQRQAIREADPAYESDIAGLKTRLGAQHKAMADLLADGAASEGDIQAQATRMAEAEQAVERRVMQHLFEIRKHLSPPQARRLMSLAASEVLLSEKLRVVPACCASGVCKCSKAASPASTQGKSADHDADASAAHG